MFFFPQTNNDIDFWLSTNISTPSSESSKPLENGLSEDPKVTKPKVSAENVVITSEEDEAEEVNLFLYKFHMHKLIDFCIWNNWF